MNQYFAFALVTAITLATVLSPSRAEAAQSCQRLTTLSLPNNVTITSAVSIVASGTLPAHCQVLGVAKPTSGSAINFEVLLPAAWNRKYLQAGNGGYGGGHAAPLGGVVTPVQRGDAAGGPDMGHSAAGPGWGVGPPQRIAARGFLADHVPAPTAKDDGRA